MRQEKGKGLIFVVPCPLARKGKVDGTSPWPPPKEGERGWRDIRKGEVEFGSLECIGGQDGTQMRQFVSGMIGAQDLEENYKKIKELNN
jgi:hypothetical protein